MNGKAFCREELNRARRLLEKDGCTFREVDEILGRAPGSVHQKFKHIARATGDWTWLNKVRQHSKEIGQRRRRADAAMYRADPTTFVYRGPSTEPVVPQAAIIERSRAYDSPHTLNQMILGDPLPGRSALDRMRGGQP